MTCFRNYPDAALEHATGGVQAGRARDDVAAIEALPGFEDVAALGGRLTVASVLGVAFDEASARWTRAQPRAGGAAARWDPSRRSWRGRARN